MITRKTITYNCEPHTLNWKGNDLIDWVDGGNIYSLQGEVKSARRVYGYKFDAAIQSDDETYAVIYEKLGTKGLLLKNGEVLRELDRSYYHADVYEYPIAFVKLADEYGIIHCPQEYNLIEIESVETGEKITTAENRNPADCFHSRFRVNPANSTLLNTGWVWHPFSILEIYSIQEGITDNAQLDNTTAHFPSHAEICSAEFVTDDLVVVSSAKEEPLKGEELNDFINMYPGQIGLYSITQKKFLKKITLDFDLGTLVPVSDDFVIDLYGHPKLIDLNSGEVIQRFEDIFSGNQNSSIIHYKDPIPPIAVNLKNRRIAIGNGNEVELLTIG